jgi:hypothetical protein
MMEIQDYLNIVVRYVKSKGTKLMLRNKYLKKLADEHSKDETMLKLDLMKEKARIEVSLIDAGMVTQLEP